LGVGRGELGLVVRGLDEPASEALDAPGDLVLTHAAELAHLVSVRVSVRVRVRIRVRVRVRVRIRVGVRVRVRARARVRVSSPTMGGGSGVSSDGWSRSSMPVPAVKLTSPRDEPMPPWPNSVVIRIAS